MKMVNKSDFRRWKRWESINKQRRKRNHTSIKKSKIKENLNNK